MMKQCSDLSVSSNKAALFQQKKSVSEVTPAKVKSQQFVASNKACDWSNLSTNVGESFAAPPVIQPKGLQINLSAQLSIYMSYLLKKNFIIFFLSVKDCHFGVVRRKFLIFITKSKHLS